MSNAGVSVLNMFPQQSSSPTLGVPSNGFASRGKNSHLRSIAVPTNSAAPGDRSAQTPRTARGHLLANLRTAPKTPVSTPTTGHLNEAAATNVDNRFANFPRSSTFAPKTARGLGLNSTGFNTPGSASPQLPTPPASSPMFTNDYGVQNMTNQLYNMSFYELALQQQRLQQQLIAAQQAQQQLEALQAAQASPASYATPPMSPYVANGGQQNYYTVYNPNTNQYAVYMTPTAQQQQMYTPSFQQVQEPSPPSPEQLGTANSSRSTSRSRSPPKLAPVVEGSTQQPQGSLPFRRGHRKTSSLSNCLNINTADLAAGDGPKTAVPKLSNLPTTPMTATFAPGHASGTHPTRQPRGPPPLDEIVAKPTAKMEGSKNFVSRQRRRAVFKLVSAGIERRGNGAPSRSTSGGQMTPVSENEALGFEEASQGTLSGRQSLQSLRSSGENSVSGDEQAGGRFVEVRKVPGGLKPQGIFEAAEKRRSALF